MVDSNPTLSHQILKAMKWKKKLETTIVGLCRVWGLGLGVIYLYYVSIRAHVLGGTGSTHVDRESLGHA